MDTIDPNLVDKMRRFAAGEDEDEGGGEGVGKFSEEELALGRELVESMDPDLLDAILQLPDEELESIMRIELKKRDVDDVDIPDIIQIIRDVREGRKAGAKPEGEGNVEA